MRVSIASLKLAFVAPLAILVALGSSIVLAPAHASAATRTVFNSSGIIITCTFRSASPGYQDVSLTASNRDSKTISDLRIISSYNNVSFGTIYPWGSKTISTKVANTSYTVKAKYQGLSYYVTLGYLAFGNPKSPNC